MEVPHLTSLIYQLHQLHVLRLKEQRRNFIPRSHSLQHQRLQNVRVRPGSVEIPGFRRILLSPVQPSDHLVQCLLDDSD